MLVLVLDNAGGENFDHEQEHEHDYERIRLSQAFSNSSA